MLGIVSAQAADLFKSLNKIMTCMDMGCNNK